MPDDVTKVGMKREIQINTLVQYGNNSAQMVVFRIKNSKIKNNL
jgi:hypothetical protein